MWLRRTLLLLLVLVIFYWTGTGLQDKHSHDSHEMRFSTPATVWDEALPLGNGLLGALVWGDGRPLNISLDRTDLWDLRPVPEFHSEEYSYATMQQWVKEKRVQDLQRIYETPYRNPGPTKIPAGRIELMVGEDPVFSECSLDMDHAVAAVEFQDKSQIQVFTHAQVPCGIIRINSPHKVKARLVVPAFGGSVQNADPQTTREMEVGLLGYAPPETHDFPDWAGYVQTGWQDFRFAVVLKWALHKNTWIGVWSIATSEDSPDPLSAAISTCDLAMERGYQGLWENHMTWWHEFWEQSSIQVPNPIIEKQWYMETYKFGSAARSDTPPITLQGPWTADNGLLPPWKGDYHHDLNTELSYWPAYSGNHLQGAEGFVNWLWATREAAKDWTRRFFGLPGLNVPMTADLNQNQIGGWHQYTHSATTAGWLAQHFYLHWRYTLDQDFLRDRAYPWFKEVAEFFEAVTEKGPNGLRSLPLSSSPEINDNRLEAWFPSITNYDLALIRYVFEKAAELGQELGLDKEADHWVNRLREMPEFALDPESQKLLVAKEYPLERSHRHFSHLMAIHPLGQIRHENGPSDQKIIESSLADLERLGTEQWTGYSFSWLANLAARARDGASAERALEIFATAFCLRSGFHCNGDQSGKGYSRYTYRPFTLEGNFAAAAGIQEMLLQSYSGVIQVFPAVPDTWGNVSFATLRAEGAFLVSAERKRGRIINVHIRAEKAGECRLADPFSGKEYSVSGIPEDAVSREKDTLRFKLKPNQEVIFRAAR